MRTFHLLLRYNSLLEILSIIVDLGLLSGISDRSRLPFDSEIAFQTHPPHEMLISKLFIFLPFKSLLISLLGLIKKLDDAGCAFDYIVSMLSDFLYFLYLVSNEQIDLKRIIK